MEVQGVEGMANFARGFIQGTTEHTSDGAVVVGLYGDLGAGKTTFVQCVARELGITERVTSPTFVMRKKYAIKNHNRFSKLIHIDAYRLSQPEDLSVLDWDKDLEDRQALILIEWADRIEDALPKNTIRLSFMVTDEHTRNISYGKK